MKKRIDIQAIEPNAYKAMFCLEGYLEKSSINKSHLTLIKIRASQINKCAFCIAMHTKEALNNGETEERIFLLNAWEESALFTKEEKVILTMTEEITFINRNGLSNEVYNKALEAFEENYIVHIIMAIVTINAWNRIAISTRKTIGN